MATITLSKGESYTFTRTGAVTTLIGSSDHAHGVMRVSNNLYMSASGNITHTIDSATANSDIHFKTNVGSFKLGYDNSTSVFNLRTGTADYPGLNNAATVFQVSTGDGKMYVPNGLQAGSSTTSTTIGLVVSGSAIFRPPNIGSTTNLRTLYPALNGELGSLAIGWNKSAGNGEIDFISGRAGGTNTAGGGFAFYDLPKSGDTGGGTNTNGVLICRMFGNTTDYNGPYFKVEGRTQTNQLLVNTSIPSTYLNATYVATFNGNVAGTSAFANSSDKRLKRDILPIENALDKILMLNGVTYNWNKEFDPDLNLDDNTHIGLLAQDVEKIIPLVVHTDNSKNQIKSMTYTELIPVLIEAIKEQQTQINELKNKLKDIPYG